ncbi:hypothetical protein [Actinokineospora sp.]|uniref:hypothetical protein n=1 Tax=Actinokineospora sp. TaxID=1872133 RepID=UPI003D6C4051
MADKPRGRPVPPSPERRQQLNALAQLHDDWVDEHLPDAEFDAQRARAKTPSDYNQHYLDVNPPTAAADEFFERARALMGLDPDTGLPA